ncbi:hypothetical protein XH96_08615 [Bradyrhizobium sp. CCBAU 51765]|nr:hypothetical protein XH96_08615 [Bradyrhizobium sp. CCBAU 51765]
MPMYKRFGRRTALAASLLFNWGPALAADASTTSAVHGIAAGSLGQDQASEHAGTFRQAPIGHRQPRPGDIPEGMRLSPLELELRRIDEEVDRRLIICRGC